MRVPAAVIVIAVFAVFATGIAHGSGADGLQGQIITGSFQSAAGPIAYDVYLPPDYATAGLRYPVLYYLHGLPAGPDAFGTFTYVPLALEQAGLRAIVVAPQGATAADSDPEYLDKGPGEDWDTAISLELPQQIDAQYRTIATRHGRAILGVSAGGYGAMLLGLHHLARFSAIESWSGYFHPTDPDGTVSISSRPWLSAHSFAASLARAFVINPTFVGFYVGESDMRFGPENIQFARELTRARVPFLFRIYPGGHTQTLWTAEAPTWLAALLAHLAVPSPA
jgi:S-formylglutathione hydrolase FrmB